MNTYRHAGHRLTHTNASGSTIVSGEVVDIGDIFGIAVADIANAAAGELEVSGVHNLAATAADSWAIGASLYWNATTSKLTDTASGNQFIGYAAAAKAASATTADVLLNGSPGL